MPPKPPQPPLKKKTRPLNRTKITPTKKKNTNVVSNVVNKVNKGLRASDKFLDKATGADQFKKVLKKGLTPEQRAKAAARGVVAGGAFVGGNAAIRALLRSGSVGSRGLSGKGE